jgi:hypothetical protein
MLLLLKQLPQTFHLLAILLLFTGTGAGIWGGKLFIRGLRFSGDPSAPLWIVRGLRGLVVMAGTWVLAGGILFSQIGLIVFGSIFLAEELYETGILALILRTGGARYG